MKNACIVWNHQNNGLRTLDFAPVLDGFRAFGYPVDELRMLSGADNQKLCAAVSALKTEYDNVILITEKAWLDYVKAVLVAGGLFTENAVAVNADGEGIFTDKNKSLFLLYFGASNQFIKSVCMPYLRQKHADRRAKMTVRAVGANAIHVEKLIEKAKSYSGDKMTYSHTREYGEDTIEAFYDENAPKMLVDDVLRVFAEGLGDSVYALDDTPLAEQLVYLLKLRCRKISVAESFTGGGLAKKITSVSGASAVYFEGLNTYNEIAKIKRLGVSEYTLKTLGAVSDQTAYEMASGLIATGDCDISIATTGLAGPNTDKSMLPVGLCYIAIGTKERVFVYRYKFDGSREEITQTAINYALFLAYKQLKNM